MAFEPSHFDCLLQEGTRLKAVGQAEDANRILNEALGLDPRNPLLLTLLAEIAADRRDYEQALGLLDSAIAAEPACAPAWFHRSHASWFTGRREAALDAARHAAEIQPMNTQYRVSYVQYAAWLNRLAEARAALMPLLNAAADSTEAAARAFCGLGTLAIAEGRFADASQYLEQSLRLQPDSATRFLLGLNQLRTGNFVDGWVNYQAREAMRHYYPYGSPSLRGERWTGQDARGLSLLIFDDQGHGDAIQFFRFLPLLRRRGFRSIAWLTVPALARLFAASAPGVTVLDALPDHFRADFNCSSSALPRWLGITVETIPAPRAYLRAPRGKAPHLALPSGVRPWIGLAWSGDPAHVRDHLRSIPAELFLRLTDGVPVGFHSLQHAVRDSDQAALDRRPHVLRSIEAAGDFADTAARIARLDLVISVDTAVAHLAGALGKPVWLIVDAAADWRWLTDRDDTPWYPDMRLFRSLPGEADWIPVLSRVASAMRHWLAGLR